MQHSPFVVDQLKPEAAPDNGGFYQLSQNSVSPTRIIGYDDAGLPIEETLPHCASRYFVMPDGEINLVPLRTSAVPSREPESERYEYTLIRDLIRAGAIPLDTCPHTTDYRATVGGPLVTPPKGEAACDGAPKGCAHMGVVREKRKAIHKAKHDRVQAAPPSISPESMQQMTGAVATGVAEGVASSMAKLRANAERFKKGEGE